MITSIALLILPVSFSFIPLVIFCMFSLTQEYCSLNLLILILFVGPIICINSIIKSSIYSYSISPLYYFIIVLSISYGDTLSILLGSTNVEVMIGDYHLDYIVLLGSIIITYKLILIEF